MAGYSGSPLPKKLGIKAGHRVAVLHPPDEVDRILGELPPDAAVQIGMSGKSLFDVLLLFVTRRAELERQLSQIRRRMTPAAGFWVAWPKKASGITTDMSGDVVREVALPTGLVDNKICAIDDTWSGLRLVIRLEHRSS